MAKQNLTAKFLESVKTEKLQEDFWDQKTSCLGIRVTKSGRKTWFVFYRFNGKKRRLSLGTYPALSLHEARQRALDTLKMSYLGTDPSRPQSDIIFRDLADKFMEDYSKVQKKSWKGDERTLQTDILPVIGDRPLHQIVKRDIVLMLEGISSRGAGVQANRTLALVRKIFNYGVEKDLTDTNPSASIKKPTKEVSRDRVLTRDEISTVWKKLDRLQRDSRNLIKLMMLSAQRSTEVKHMRWQDLDFKEMVWTIPGEFTKNGKSNRVPITALMKDIISEQVPYRFKSMWVFPCKIDKKRPFQSHQKAVQKLKALCEIEFRGHDLRRTVATTIASLGVNRLVITKLLNHSETSITGVYDRHSYDHEKRQALDLWEKYLFQVVSDEKKSAHGNIFQRDCGKGRPSVGSC